MGHYISQLQIPRKPQIRLEGMICVIMHLSFVSKEIVLEADSEKMKRIWMSCKQNAGERNNMERGN